MIQDIPEDSELKHTNREGKLTLNQDDFIEWVLKNTNDVEAEFRVYKTAHYIMVGIDKKKWMPEEVQQT